MPYKDAEVQRAAQAKHYLENREAYRRRSRETWERRKEWLRSIKDGKPCADCGVPYPSRVMQFHHTSEEEKVANIATLLRTRGRQAILDEIAKCVLLCANCHALRHVEDEAL